MCERSSLVFHFVSESRPIATLSSRSRHVQKFIFIDINNSNSSPQSRAQVCTCPSVRARVLACVRACLRSVCVRMLQLNVNSIELYWLQNVLVMTLVGTLGLLEQNPALWRGFVCVISFLCSCLRLHPCVVPGRSETITYLGWISNTQCVLALAPLNGQVAGACVCNASIAPGPNADFSLNGRAAGGLCTETFAPRNKKDKLKLMRQTV
jgi:hypothetical protein